jgi:hypothetical protein
MNFFIGLARARRAAPMAARGAMWWVLQTIGRTRQLPAGLVAIQA